MDIRLLRSVRLDDHWPQKSEQFDSNGLGVLLLVRSTTELCLPSVQWYNAEFVWLVSW